MRVLCAYMRMFSFKIQDVHFKLKYSKVMTMTSSEAAIMGGNDSKSVLMASLGPNNVAPSYRAPVVSGLKD